MSRPFTPTRYRFPGKLVPNVSADSHVLSVGTINAAVSTAICDLVPW